MALLEPFIGYLLAGLTMLLGFVGVYMSGKSSGKKDAVIDDLVANKEAQKEARNALDKNLNADADDIARGL